MTFPEQQTWDVASTGSPNAYAISIDNWTSNLPGVPLRFIPNFSNTGAATLNVNGLGAQAIKKLANSALTALVGGEIQSGEATEVEWDGTQFILKMAPDAILTAADQTVTGGANVNADNLGTQSSGTLTIDCGARPLQYVTNNGAFTIAAPANDGSCLLLVINAASAGAIGFSGFTVGSNTGASLDTTNGHKFTISIWRVNGVAGYSVYAHQ
ncbi:MAG TPA: hypothetical protein VKW08_07735 [Xanthobacteraceae bacterium]|nr:hypothetical protein [Xanthobacteraceae bacterium]